MGSRYVECSLVGGGKLYFRRTTFENAKKVYDYLRRLSFVNGKIVWRGYTQIGLAVGLNRKSVKACVEADALIRKKRVRGEPKQGRYFRLGVKFWKSFDKSGGGMCSNRVALSLGEINKVRAELVVLKLEKLKELKPVKDVKKLVVPD